MQRTLDQFPGNAGFPTANSPETWSTATRNQKIIYLGLTQLLGKATVAEATFSQMLSHTNSTFPVDQPGYSDVATGRVSGGWPTVSGPENQRNNTAVKGTFSRFQDLLGGSHNFKAGIEGNISPYEQDRILPGDMIQLLQNGVPYRVDLYNTPLTFTARTSRLIGFVQDGWTMGERVTANLGLRLEKSVGSIPAESGGGGAWFPQVNYPERDVIHWFAVTPRLGVVWDVSGDKRTSVKVSYDRYHNAIDTTMALRANNNTASFQEYDWNDLNRDGKFQNGEQGTLAQPAANEEHRRPEPQTAVHGRRAGGDRQADRRPHGGSFSLIHKSSGNLLESLDIARPFSATDPITVANPTNGAPLTVYRLNPSYQGVQQILYFTNPSSPQTMVQRYWGGTMSLKKRLSHSWQAEGSLTLGHNTGNYGNSFDQTRGNSMYNNPNNLINDYGDLDLDHPVELKLQGTWTAPKGFVFSAYYSGISGYPMWDLLASPLHLPGATYFHFTKADSPLIIVESAIDVAGVPRGTVRAGFQNQLSVRAEKQVKIRRVTLNATLDAFNLLNISTVTYVQTLHTGLPTL